MPITWILNNIIAASPIAKSIEDVESWKKAGVKAIAILAEPHEVARYWGSLNNYLNVLNNKGLEYVYSPIRDFQAPELNQLKKLIEWIESKVEANKPVLVHCRAGIGRTGTIIAAYLVKKGYEAKDAITTVRKFIPLALEVDEQVSVVYEYRDSLKALK
ncbi:MAG: dual specificity protein phosphatase family protein [Thermoproteota archaeon]|nr:dual specificity protein phosphatase family protein [Candidatus Brockarchaeota archaeon]